MAQYLKADLWKKAYLIEFVGASGVLLDAFTFSVPPESEELTYSQRKSETKTFGGLHVDDYGLDAVKISLSGSTINQDLKRIYNPRNQGAEKWMTGEQEIYHLRDLIQKYKTGDELKKEIRIMLYDLSKMTFTDGKPAEGVIKNYWRVYPGDFKIRRSSDRPFAYKYSLELTAVDPSEEVSFGESSYWGWVTTAVNAVKKSSEAVKRVLTDNPVLNALKTFKEMMEEVDSNIRYLTSVIDIIGDSASFIVGSYADTLEGITNATNSVLRIPRDTTQKTLNIGNEVFNSAMGLMRSVEAISGEIRLLIDGPKEYFAPQELLDAYGMTANEYADTWAGICWQMENDANAIASFSKSNEVPAEIIPGQLSVGETGRQTATMVYGYYSVPLKDTDTLESLAAGHMGNPDSAIDIATYNGIASLDELNPGDSVKIPVTKKSGGNTNNRIYARPGDRDNYGRDIALDEDGRVTASASGDFKLIVGVDNLSQAILLRLRESVNKRIRLNTYGIRTNISDPAAGTAYVLSSIDLTVRSDPRVKAVDNTRFAGTGDGLNVAVDYQDINGGAGNAKGRA